jgi:N-acetylgalactosamine-6-sulfatase
MKLIRILFFLSLSQPVFAGGIASESFETGSSGGYTAGVDFAEPRNLAVESGNTGFEGTVWKGFSATLQPAGPGGLSHPLLAGGPIDGHVLAKGGNADGSPLNRSTRRALAAPPSGDVFYLSGLFSLPHGEDDMRDGDEIFMGVADRRTILQKETTAGIHIGLRKDRAGVSLTVFADGRNIPLGEPLTASQSAGASMIVVEVRLGSSSGRDTLRAWYALPGETSWREGAALEGSFISDRRAAHLTHFGLTSRTGPFAAGNTLGAAMDEMRFGTSFEAVASGSRPDGVAASALPSDSSESADTAVSPEPDPRKDGPPNFVFLFADDLGWGDMSAYGNQKFRTPHLDRFASEGTLFTQGYVASPVCSPSRAAALTGLFPARTGIHGHIGERDYNRERGMPDYLDPSLPTLARTLQAAGYRTGHVGKWHLGSGSEAPTLPSYGIDWHRHTHGPGGSFDATTEEYREHASEWFADAAIEFLEENRNRPFYLNVWFTHPHATATEPSVEQLAPFESLMPRRVKEKWPGSTAIYAATVAELDRQAGRVLDAIDELGLADNTVVIFSSDNGPEDQSIRNARHTGVGSAGPFRGRKRSIYEGGVRVPFLVRWPGEVPEGRVDSDAVVSVVDLYPTIAGLAGAETPAGLDGEDVSGLWLGDGTKRSKSLMWEWRFGVSGHVMHHSPILAIRRGDWKLLCNPDGERVELYHIPTDPMEINNRADEEKEIVSKLATEVLEWQSNLPDGPVSEWAGSDAYPWPGADQ